MADNVTVDNGGLIDYPVAADEVTYSGDTSLVQLVRLAGVTGSEGSKTVVPVEITSDGLARVDAHRDAIRISAASGSLTTTSPTYVSGDQVGSMFSFANAARASGGTGVITSVVLVDAFDIIGAYDVVFFRSNITLAADNAVFNIATDADAIEICGLVQLAGAFDIGGQRIAQAFNLAVPYDCSGGTTLYAALICRAAHGVFGATSNLQLTIFVERN